MKVGVPDLHDLQTLPTSISLATAQKQKNIHLRVSRRTDEQESLRHIHGAHGVLSSILHVCSHLFEGAQQ